jgi:hypothetical protein
MEIIDGIHVALSDSDLDQLKAGKCIMARGSLMDKPVIFYVIKMDSPRVKKAKEAAG